MREHVSWPYDSLDVCDPELRKKHELRLFEAQCQIMEMVAQTRESIQASQELLTKVDLLLSRKLGNLG